MSIAIKHQGMTLIEVLVSIILLAIGMLGIASMLMLSNKANNSSYAKQQAVQCVYDIFDRIRANSDAAAQGNYNISNIGGNGQPTTVSAPGVNCGSAPCSSAQLANYDTWYWLTKVVSQLPNGSGSITTSPASINGNTLVTVTVQWDESYAQSEIGTSSSNANNANFVQLRVQGQI